MVAAFICSSHPAAVNCGDAITVLMESKKPSSLNPTYPEITLSDARKARDDARQLLANGVDPGAVIKAQKIQVQLQAEIVLNTFEKVAKEWLLKNSPQWSDSHIKTITSRLDRDVFPVFGDHAVTSITRNDVKCLMEKVAARGTIETADRIKLYCRQILRYALNNGMVESNPIDDMKDILAKRVVKDPNGRAYNRTAHHDERKKMMQLWADYLEKLKVLRTL